jgi:N-acetylglucosaminyl-diphospho-decaprenol L-rhamnosyltransferase
VTDENRPRVDVVVVTWNTRGVTPDALRRLLDADQGTDLRVLVRDNASSDGTAEAVRAAVPEAEVEAGSENLGFAAGVNRLLARTTAPWILLLNPDAWPEPGAVGRLVAAARARPRAAAVAPRILRPDGTLEHSTHPFPSLRVAAITALWRGRVSRETAWRLMLEGAWMHDRARPVDWAVGAALLLRREALEDVGPLDERFFVYAEDLEWCWRARRRGWEIWFEPAAVVRHIGNVSGALAYADRRAAASMVNTYRFYRRVHGPAAAAAYRALNLLGAGLRYAAARAGGRPGEARYWRSLLAAHLTPARAEIRPAPPAPGPAEGRRP